MCSFDVYIGSREYIQFDHRSKPATLLFSSGTFTRQADGEVVDGKLKLYFDATLSRHHAHHQSSKSVQCSVYLRGGNGTAIWERSSENHLLDSRMLSVRSPGWKTFHITEAVRAWFNSGPDDTQLALVIVVSGHSAEDVFQLEQGSLSSPAMAAFQPRLEVLYEENFAFLNRERRQSETPTEPYTCNEEDDEERCCRYEQTITFRELGWDKWICFPDSYVAYQCMGTCPMNHRLASPYSRIKSVMHELDPDEWNAPCCSPTKFSPLILMMINSTENFELVVQQDMIVDECKCLWK